MFKKSLAAVAILGAFAGSAVAADVTLYGLADLGLNYIHTDADVGSSGKDDSFTMRAGQNSGSRFGLKGTEDLGNGLKVGFVLENGFDADTGSLTTAGKIFDREAQAYLEGAFGRISMGRVGQLASMNGSYGILGVASPFSSGWGQTIGPKHVMAVGLTRFDNTVTYVTPDFAGFKVHAQYSFQNAASTTEPEGKSGTNRYYGIGATYNAGPLALVGVVDSINYKGETVGKDEDHDDDSLSVTLGGSYDFEVVKVYALGQYFDNAEGTSKIKVQGVDYQFTGTGGIEGWGLSLGVSAPAFGGTARAQMGYMDAEEVRADADGKDSFNRYMFAVGYDYNLSKRTTVYTAASYMKDKWDYAAKDEGNWKPSAYELFAGMIHRF